VRIENDGMKAPEGVLNAWQFEKVKKDDPGAVAALVVDGPKAGKVIHVKPYTRNAPSAPEAGRRPLDLDGKRKMLESRRCAITIGKVRELLEASVMPAADKSDLFFLRLVASFGTTNPGFVFDSAGFGFDNLDEAAKFDTDQLKKQVWKLVSPEIAKTLDFHQPTHVPDWAVDAAKRICDILMLDWDVLKSDADAELPEPKSWAREIREAAAESEEGDRI
jgi:hypothetical protein